MLKRLKRAIEHATLLSKLLKDQSATALAQAEATAYCNVLQASYFFEKADGKSSEAALKPLEDARRLLDLISQKTPQMTAQALAYELLEDVEQMSRIVAHRLGRSNTSTSASEDVQALEKALGGIEAGAVKYQTDFKWKDQTVVVRNPVLAKALSQGQLTVKDKTVAALEKKLTVLGQGEDLARRLAEENQVGGVQQCA